MRCNPIGASTIRKAAQDREDCRTESTTKAEMIMDLTSQLFGSSREMIKALGIPTDLACWGVAMIGKQRVSPSSHV
jgi:hypothetical protein